MNRTVRLVVSVLLFSGCASSAPSPLPPVARPFDDIGRVAIVVSGEGNFAIAEDGVEPGRTLDEILKWYPYGGALRPVAKLVHRAINRLRNVDAAAAATRNVDGISPGATVARAMAQTLQASGAFTDVRTLERDPGTQDRAAREDAVLVRVTVPAWGLVRVREGEPGLVSTYADVRAEMIRRETGVVVWSDG